MYFYCVVMFFSNWIKWSWKLRSRRKLFKVEVLDDLFNYVYFVLGFVVILLDMFGYMVIGLEIDDGNFMKGFVGFWVVVEIIILWMKFWLSMCI